MIKENENNNDLSYLDKAEKDINQLPKQPLKEDVPDELVNIFENSEETNLQEEKREATKVMLLDKNKDENSTEGMLVEHLKSLGLEELLKKKGKNASEKTQSQKPLENSQEKNNKQNQEEKKR